MLSYRSKISILDWGGGVGKAYFRNKKHFTSPNSVVWNVVDVEEIIVAAQKEHMSEERITFQSDISNVKKVDIVFLNQSLQVVENYKECLQNIIERFHPLILFISGVPSGENEEYVTLLLLDGRYGVPTYVMNERELLGFVNEQGYSLLYRFIGGKVNLANYSDNYQLDSNKDNYIQSYILVRKEENVQ